MACRLAEKDAYYFSDANLNRNKFNIKKINKNKIFLRERSIHPKNYIKR